MSDAKAKIKRMVDALEGRQPDRVPVSDFFWSGFVRRCRKELGLGETFNPYRHWDLDYVVITPNMDPHLNGLTVLENTPERKLVKTGFETLIERRRDLPVPHYVRHYTEDWKDIESFRFDDPLDARRYHAPLDDQINCVSDELNIGIMPFVQRVGSYARDFCVFGSVCEPHELLWRICGTENTLYKMGQEPKRLARFIARIGDFLVGVVEGQIAAARGALTGIYIWGDIAYRNSMFFSPSFWRDAYLPELEKICAAAFRHGLKVVYHGCGNASPVYADLMRVGIHGYNPVEAKAGLDVVDLKRRHGRTWCWIGNIDVRVLEKNDHDLVRQEVLRKLNAAKGGGYIPQSDHSVSSGVSAHTYDRMVKLVREYGRYPMDLGVYDLDMDSLPAADADGAAIPRAARRRRSPVPEA